jgi:hypothetical protein
MTEGKESLLQWHDIQESCYPEDGDMFLQNVSSYSNHTNVMSQKTFIIVATMKSS